MIVRAQIQRESYGFGTFTATKVAEIQSRTSKDEWWRIAEELNPSDLSTRATNSRDMQSNSVWQTWPEFLERPVEEWPISQECVIEETIYQM
jgi:hypothetical protein